MYLRTAIHKLINHKLIQQDVEYTIVQHSLHTPLAQHHRPSTTPAHQHPTLHQILVSHPPIVLPIIRIHHPLHPGVKLHKPATPPAPMRRRDIQRFPLFQPPLHPPATTYPRIRQRPDPNPFRFILPRTRLRTGRVLPPPTPIRHAAGQNRHLHDRVFASHLLPLAVAHRSAPLYLSRGQSIFLAEARVCGVHFILVEVIHLPTHEWRLLVHIVEDVCGRGVEPHAEREQRCVGYQCVQGGDESFSRKGSSGEGEDGREMCEQRSGYAGDVGVKVSWEEERRWLWLVQGGFVDLCWG